MTEGTVNVSGSPASPEVIAQCQRKWVSGWLGIEMDNNNLSKAVIIAKLHAARRWVSQRAPARSLSHW